MKTYLLTFNISLISLDNEALTTILSEVGTIENYEDLNSLDRAEKLNELISSTHDAIARKINLGAFKSITEIKIGAVTPL